MQQRRVAGGRVQQQTWNMTTDGQWHALDGHQGMTGRATWTDGRLALELAGPGAHRERTIVEVRGNRMICNGTTERARYRAVFERE
jgi:hypothetical protein